MGCAFLVLVLAAVAFASPLSSESGAPQRLSDTEEFQDVVEYLNENASGSDIYNLIESFSDILDYVSLSDDSCSLSNAVHEVFRQIPWVRISRYIQAKLATDPKFAKIYAMVNYPRFRKVIDQVVNSQAVRDFLHSVQTNGFTWPAFINFALKAVCETTILSFCPTTTSTPRKFART